MEYHREVARKELDGHGQEDDAEEFSQDIDDVGSEPVGDFVEVAQHDVVDHDIEEETYHDVDRLVLGMERDEGCDGARPGDEGKGDGHDAGTRRGGFVLDDITPQNHLEGQDEEHHGAGNGKGGHVDAEEAQQGIAEEIESDEEQQCDTCGLEGFDFRPLVAHRDEDGDGARDVDDGKHHEEGAEYLDKTNHSTCI